MSARIYPAARRSKASASVALWAFVGSALLLNASRVEAAPDVTAPPRPSALMPVDTIVSPLPGFLWTPVVDGTSRSLVEICGNGADDDNDGTVDEPGTACEDLSGLASYTMELSQFASFSSTIVTYTGTAPSFQLPADKRLTFGSTYFWRVTSRDNAGNTNTSPIFTFTVQARKVSYTVTVDDDCAGGFATPVINVVTTLTAASDSRFPLSEGIQYCWRVEASDLAGNKKVSTTNRLLLADRFGPTAAVLDVPEEGSLLIDDTPGFVWLPSLDPGAVTYTLQVSTNSQFSTLLNIGGGANLTTTGYQVPASNPLPRGAAYFARVLSRDTIGNITTGAAVKFRVDDKLVRYTLSLGEDVPASRTMNFDDGALPAGTQVFGNAALDGAET